MRGVRILLASRLQDLGRPSLWSVDGVVWPAEAVCEVARFRAPGNTEHGVILRAAIRR